MNLNSDLVLLFLVQGYMIQAVVRRRDMFRRFCGVLVPGFTFMFRRFLIEVGTNIINVDMEIAMAHFELSARERQIKGKWEINDPNITLPNQLIEYIASWSAKE